MLSCVHKLKPDARTHLSHPSKHVDELVSPVQSKFILVTVRSFFGLLETQNVWRRRGSFKTRAARHLLISQRLLAPPHNTSAS